MEQTGNYISMQINRTYKDRLFIMIFNSKKELLELYNAANGTNYDDPELLEINTLENAIYLSGIRRINVYRAGSRNSDHRVHF